MCSKHPTLSCDLCVDDVISQTSPNPLELGDPGGELPDGVHLAAQELVLQEVTEMRITISHPVSGQETLIHLQYSSGKHNLKCFVYFTVFSCSRASWKATRGESQAMLEGLGLEIAWKTTLPPRLF